MSGVYWIAVWLLACEASTDERIAALEQELAEATAQLETLQSQLAATSPIDEDSMLDLQAQVDANVEQIATLSASLDLVDSGLLLTEEDVVDLAARVADLEEGGAVSGTQVSAIEDAVESLETLTSTHETQIETLESATQTTNASIDDVEERLTTVEDAYLSTSVASSTYLTQSAASSTYLAPDDITELETTLASHTSTLGTLETDVDELETAVSGHTTDIAALDSDLGGLEAQTDGVVSLHLIETPQNNLLSCTSITHGTATPPQVPATASAILVNINTYWTGGEDGHHDHSVHNFGRRDETPYGGWRTEPYVGDIWRNDVSITSQGQSSGAAHYYGNAFGTQIIPLNDDGTYDYTICNGADGPGVDDYEYQLTIQVNGYFD